MSHEALWHRLEHSGYTADLPCWLNLARRYGPKATEIGAGCGRVSSFLAAHGVSVTGVEKSRPLAQALRASRPPGSCYEVVEADAAQVDVSLLGELELVLFPLLVLQVICAERGHMEGLDMVSRFDQVSGHIAVSLSEDLPGDLVLDVPHPQFASPTSDVTRLQDEGDNLIVERARRWRGLMEVQIEEIRKLSLSDLVGAIGRDPLEVVTIPACEGVVASKVVVF